MNYSKEFAEIWEKLSESIQQQMISRGYRVANELRNTSLQVLSGPRSGRVYKIPGTYGKRLSKHTQELVGDYGHKLRGGVLYRASAPGEPPANRTGIYRLSWQSKTYATSMGEGKLTVISQADSNYRVKNGRLLGDILENGTDRMAPRPHQEVILEKTEPKAVKIYKEPYF